ncbi:MAG: hypothetical protein P1V97_37820 [Planctomycetota bacterium]|nr:hypothetical protein [Planctomycetota bacterium]
MGHDNYYETDKYRGGPAPKKALPNLRIFIALLGGLIFSGCVLSILPAFLSPRLSQDRMPAWKQKCANNLKGVALGMIMYANERQYFPHMTELNKGHTNEEISDVYRTLIQQKYCENAKIFVCQQSNHSYLEANDIAVTNPKFWDWSGKEDSAKPACLQSSRVDVLKNSELSYTYRRNKLRGDSSRSDDMIIADKARKDSDGKGCHPEGYNIGYADGHVDFAHKREVELIGRLRKRLIIGH